jgi:transposase
MDNAKIHHREGIAELICETGRWLESLLIFTHQALAGVRLEYLPPYSPDLNPIEEAFLKIKSFICRNQEYFSDDVNGLIYDMYIAMDVITDSDAEGYIIHAGYF